MRKKGWGLFLRDVKDNWLGIVIAAAAILAFQLIFSTICPMQLFFGLPCPGCGLTRAAFLLLRGQVKAAFFMHPFLFVWILVAVYWAFFRYVIGKSAKGFLQLVSVVCILMVCFYIYRMIRYFPDKEPMNPLVTGIVNRAWSHVR